MARRRQRRMDTAAESAEIWDRWQKGEGLGLIGRVFGKTSSQIFAHLKPHGGIRPAPRRRSRTPAVAIANLRRQERMSFIEDWLECAATYAKIGPPREQ